MKTILLICAFCACSIAIMGQDCKVGNSYFELGKYQEAITEYNSCLSQYADDATIENAKVQAEKCLDLLDRAQRAENNRDYIRALDLYTELYTIHQLAAYENKSSELQELADKQQIEIEKESRGLYNEGLEFFHKKDYDKAISKFYSAASKGHIKAMYYLGECCYAKNEWLGVWNSNSYTTLYAKNEYQRAAEKGYAPAMVKIGTYYEYKNDLSNAVQYYIQASKQNESDAINRIVELCVLKRITINDEIKDVFYLAAHNGNKDAQYQVAMWAYESNNIADAKYWLQQATNNGHVQASAKLTDILKAEELMICKQKADSCYALRLYNQAVSYYSQLSDAESLYLLGMCYVNTQDNRAINHLTKAANAGNVDAMYQLGECYQYGTFVTSNEMSAIAWYEKAASNGHQSAKEEAQKLLAIKQNRENIVKWNMGGDAAYRSGEYDVAIAWYSKSVAKEDQYALLQLAKCYMYKTPIDSTNAYQTFMRVASQGNAEALYGLGQCYQKGIGVAASDSLACVYYQKAVVAGHTGAGEMIKRIQNNAEIERNLLLAKDYTARESYSEAIPYYRKAIELGCDSCFYELGICYLQNNNSSALECFKKAANQGNRDAMYELGEMYQYAKFVNADETNAIMWYQKAAGMGHSVAKTEASKLLKIKERRENIAKWNLEGDAMCVVGLYEQAIALYNKSIAEGDEYAVDAHKRASEMLAEKQKNDQIKQFNQQGDSNFDRRAYVTAVTFYQEASNLGDAYATRQLGRCYQFMGSSHYVAAFKCYQHASILGDVEATFCMAECYASGLGVEVNKNIAYSYYLKAANANHLEAQLAVAKCFEKGIGVNSDMTEAIKWYHKAADSGSAYAKCVIAELYEKGKIDGTKNYGQAFVWYLDAANAGDANAQYKMGKYIENGWETSKRKYNSSKYWYSKANAQGHSKAKSRLIAINNEERRSSARESNRISRQNSYANYKSNVDGFTNNWGDYEIGVVGASFSYGTAWEVGLFALRLRFGCFMLNPVEFTIGVDNLGMYPHRYGDIASYQPTIGYYFPVEYFHGVYLNAGPTVDWYTFTDYNGNTRTYRCPYFKVEAGYRVHFGLLDATRADFFLKYDGAFSVGVAYQWAVGW